MIATSTRRRALPLGLLASTVLATPALADVNGNWVSENEFTISLSNMPDFDQLRVAAPGVLGLPNNGNAYCVPTCVLNLGAYIARHGHPDALPGDENWQSQANYNDATIALTTLGVVGNTSPTTGTNVYGQFMQTRFAVPLDRFVVSSHIFDGFVFADIPNFARWVNEGSLISFTHGWYNQDGTINGVPNLSRNGGHCLTFQGAGRSLFSQFLSIRDPADNAQATTQSTFTSRVYDWEEQVMYLNGNLRVGTRIEPINGDDSFWRVIDSYTKVTPKMGVSLTEDNIVLVAVADGTYGFAASDLELASPDQSVIEAVAFGPDNDRLYATVRLDDGTVVAACTTIRDPEWVLFENLPLPGPSTIVFGDDRTMYTVGEGEIFRILLNTESGAPELIGARDVPERALIAFDSATDRVIMFDPETPTLSLLPDHLDGDIISLPVPIGPLAGDVDMAWDDTRGAAWVHKPGSDTLLKITPVAGAGVPLVESLVIPDGILPVDVEVDDQGHLLVSDGSKWYEFSESANGDFVAEEGSFIHGKIVGRDPQISRSRTNWNPVDFPDEQWQNVLPQTFGPGIADCLGDFDIDGEIGFSDLLTLLAAWGPCPAGAFCDADLDASGAVDFADLLSLLAAFGDCP
ncbi:MAG: hypothetical protein AB8G96_05765 [Phycisphaerales bacterium]